MKILIFGMLTPEFYNSHIRLSDREDELLWSINPVRGSYLPKLGYKVLGEEEAYPRNHWWYKSIWKFYCPHKNKLFLQMDLKRKVPTMDELQRKLWSGPNKCPICKVCYESVDHLFYGCSFMAQAIEYPFNTIFFCYSFSEQTFGII